MSLSEQEVIIRLTELAEDPDITPTKAFVTMEREGMANVKRAEFEEKFELLRRHPFQLVFARREAKEKRFRQTVLDAILVCKPSEDDVMAFNQAIVNMVQGAPVMTLKCIDLFKGLLGEAKHAELLEGYNYLWPHSKE